MISQLFHRAYRSVGQQLTFGVGGLGIVLLKQAETKIWARMVLDLFFPPVIHVKVKPGQPTLQAMQQPKAKSAVSSHFREIVRAAKATKDALTDRPVQTQFSRTSQPSAPPTETFRSEVNNQGRFSQAAVPSAVATAGPLKGSNSADWGTLGGNLESGNHDERTVVKIRMARLDTTYAETREIYGMAIALNAKIYSYEPVGSDGRLECRAPVGRIGAPNVYCLRLKGQHYEPMMNMPRDPQTQEIMLEVADDDLSLGIQEILGDGNCFFRIMAAHLTNEEDSHYNLFAHMPHDDKHKKLRELACDAVEKAVQVGAAADINQAAVDLVAPPVSRDFAWQDFLPNKVG